MASMKNKAKVVWNCENSIEARGQKIEKPKFKSQIH